MDSVNFAFRKKKLYSKLLEYVFSFSVELESLLLNFMKQMAIK